MAVSSQVYRGFREQVLGARSVERTRALHPGPETFALWVEWNRSHIPTYD